MADGAITGATLAQGLAKATATNYTTLSSIYSKVNKPDHREQLASVLGDQSVSGLNGLLRMVGASKAAGMADSVNWWEEQRLHAGVETVTGSTAVVDVSADPVTLTVATGHTFIEKDTVLLYTVLDGSVRPERAWVVSTTATTLVVRPYKDWVTAHLVDTILRVNKFSNEFGQGTDQPTEFLASDATLRNNTYYIMKLMFSVTGSQMTNIGWVKSEGSNLWYHKQETDFRQRAYDYDEMFSVLGDQITNAGLAGVADFNQNGSQGVFSAVEERGNVYEGYIKDLSNIDAVIRRLDKNAGVGEYAFYVDRQQDQHIDNMIANGNAANLSSGVSEQFGTFNNSKDMAINLGFKSFSRSSYTFHKHDYKLLNDPQLLGATDAGYYKGIIVPMKFTYDAKDGSAHPVLEINHKGVDGYSREMEDWRDGGVPLAGYKSNQDAMQFNYRCEKQTVVRGANNLFILAGGTNT